MRKSRENGLFLDIPDEQWNDWHWQVKNRVETLEELKQYIKLTPEEEKGIAATLGKLRMASPPTTCPSSTWTTPTTPSASRPSPPVTSWSSPPMRRRTPSMRMWTPPPPV